MRLIEWIRDKWYRVTSTVIGCLVSFILLFDKLGITITPDLILLVAIALILLVKG